MTTAAKRDSMEATMEAVNAKLEGTKLESQPSNKRAIGLTDLPPSVRNNIYKYALDTELVNVGESPVSYSHTMKDGVLSFKASRSPFPVNTALFYVNKQISKEALQYFYSKNLWVKFDVFSADARHAKTMLEDSGVLFSTAEPSTLDALKQHAMELTLVEKNSAQKRAIVMFPAQYLPRLINFMDMASRASGAWAPGHKIFINVMNTYDFATSRLQGDLLELFRLLNNMGGANVDPANLLPGYADNLQASMLEATFTADSWLESVGKIVDRANEAREKGEWDMANQQGQAAVIAMTYGFLTRAEQLHSANEELLKEIQRLRWRCELGIARALFEKQKSATSTSGWLNDADIPLEKRKEVATDVMAAETAASRALSLATDSPSPASNPWFQSLPTELIPPNKAEWFTDAERGSTWFVCGLIHAALGEALFAAGDLERACGLNPDGEGFENEFKKIRESIDFTQRPGMRLKEAVRLARG
ncbi:hypothetical protein BS50DRAFT_154489 [Corynespora cassiicola Philippines]|uniref:Uncharacterized protein n=1 Tax=Corynespora cassiicola Philippines TaxID=1448308 RepID=A0A2T2N6R7_CORCC|nr:hypothetical protein BS50DRAFT_154489 [Corynespora cassiicola Philippines]